MRIEIEADREDVGTLLRALADAWQPQQQQCDEPVDQGEQVDQEDQVEDDLPAPVSRGPGGRLTRDRFVDLVREHGALTLMEAIKLVGYVHPQCEHYQIAKDCLRDGELTKRSDHKYVINAGG